jgi:hypothetical protein
MATRKKEFVGGERYNFDFNQCANSEGWAQVDTGDDASYFGNWINLERLQLVSFMEGDVVTITAKDKEEFVAEFIKLDECLDDVKIDPGFNEKLESDLKEVGLGAYIH